ncbi:MAG: hypothetical protein JWN60_1148 [Acidobacteria bacterium]|jgi:hypothetical protein|nr:hypothetical protein [Acidobacteriota bacterium]
MMRNKIQYYLLVSITIVIFDVTASFTSKILEFDYTALSWVSLFLYALAGFLGYKKFDFLSGVSAGLIAGLVDSTLGWTLSSVIQPHIPFDQPLYTFPLIAEVVIVVTIKGAFFGFIGSFVYYIIRKNKNGRLR